MKTKSLKKDYYTDESYAIRIEPGTFQFEGTRRIAIASLNDHGTFVSLKIVKGYLERVDAILETVAKKNRENAKRTGKLKEISERISDDCESLEKYFGNREKFKGIATSGLMEWTTKQCLRLISRGNLSLSFNILAYRLRDFHGEVCDVLWENRVVPTWDVH